MLASTIQFTNNTPTTATHPTTGAARSKEAPKIQHHHNPHDLTGKAMA